MGEPSAIDGERHGIWQETTAKLAASEREGEQGPRQGHGRDSARALPALLTLTARTAAGALQAPAAPLRQSPSGPAEGTVKTRAERLGLSPQNKNSGNLGLTL